MKAALLALTAAALLLAQQPPAKQQEPPEPPEEDLSLSEQKVYVLNPLQAAKELKIGNFYMKKGSYKAAARRFEEATKWDPNSGEAFLKLGEAQEKLGDLKAAHAAWEQFLKLQPDHKHAGDVRKKLGKKT
jgi:outer membrane protein assembly factor BamD (BamD/ComL family)